MKHKKYTITLDDDPMVHKIIERSTGITSLPFVSPRSLLRRTTNFHPMCFFIDVELSEGQTGLDVIPEIRDRWPFVPVIVVTGSKDGDFVGHAFASGAHDFLKKPINPSELRERLQARTKDMYERKHQKLMFDDLCLDPFSRKVESASASVILNHSSFVLLQSLVQNSGLCFERKSLKRRIWGSTSVSENSLDKLISSLRAQLSTLKSNVEICCRKKKGVYISRKANSNPS